MKITNNKIGQNLNVLDTNKSDSASKLDKVKSARLNDAKELKNELKSNDIKDAARVDVSSRAMDAKKIKDIAMASPDVDEAKVAKFRKLIDEGKYKVDSKAVADRLVDEHLE